MWLTWDVQYINKIAWRIDSSFNVHPDLRGHTGDVMQFTEEYNGGLISSSNKQNHSAGSSTVDELFIIHTKNPVVLLPKRFIERLLVRLLIRLLERLLIRLLVRLPVRLLAWLLLKML